MLRSSESSGKVVMATAQTNSNSDINQFDNPSDESNVSLKLICLGDSAVGKSKQVNIVLLLYLLVERFLVDGYKPQQLSTYALTLYKYKTKHDGEDVTIDFWDTAGQERFSSMHASYYHNAHACILVFDVTRKITYKNLPNWYAELREYRSEIPCICAANKIDADIKATSKSFNFPKKHNLPLYFVSASDGTNVVKLFKDAIQLAVKYKQNPADFMDLVMSELEYYESADAANNPYDDNEDEEEPSQP
ncbi:Rab-like protein 2A [Nymphon striatum]|nr:Rab-like protein 2A [Nymphon striatum]